ncbi:MAG: hypothetical protein J5879_00105 [Clostridia bacterium]|nr:hypothetical protein [Clostridia bacterium]
MKKSEHLYRAIGGISEKTINDAVGYTAERKRGAPGAVLEAVAVAAVVCGFIALSVVLARISGQRNDSIGTDINTESNSETAVPVHDRYTVIPILYDEIIKYSPFDKMLPRVLPDNYLTVRSEKYTYTLNGQVIDSTGGSSPKIYELELIKNSSGKYTEEECERAVLYEGEESELLQRLIVDSDENYFNISVWPSFVENYAEKLRDKYGERSACSPDDIDQNFIESCVKQHVFTVYENGKNIEKNVKTFALYVFCDIDGKQYYIRYSCIAPAEDFMSSKELCDIITSASIYDKEENNVYAQS